jgi:hypothetical protein
MLEGAFSRQLAARVHTDRESRYVKELALSTDRIEEIVILFFNYVSTLIAHYPRVSSKRFTFTLTLLAMLPG